MKLQQWMKSALSVAMAFTMVVTSVPADVTANEPKEGVEAVGEDNLILHWDMTQDEDGNLQDLTGNGHSGVTNGAVEFSSIDKIPVLDMTGGYVDIPDGTISEDATEVSVNMLVKISKNIKSSWMFCLGSSNKRYLYLTGSSNQDGYMRGGIGCAPEDGNGWSYESVVGGSKALQAGEWQNITVTYKDGGDFTFFLNGEKQASITISEGKAGNCTLQNLMVAGDTRDGYMGWSFYTGDDPTFQGAVADFKIYEHELTEDEVSALYADVNETLKNLKLSDFNASNIDLTETECLGENTDAAEVETDLVLPSKTSITVEDVTKDAEITKWTSSNPDIISNEGKVTRIVKDMDVVMTASVTLNDRTVDKDLSFTVKGDPTDEGIVAWDKDALIIPNTDDIRGNITLPEVGDVGATITWESDNEDVICTTAQGGILPGQVTRQEEDTNVTLTATITHGEAETTKTFDCVVKADPGEVVTTDYLFAYFPYAGVKDERIYFGISEDGLNFEALNDSKPVLESTLGTHGLRDPFIIRSHEGDKFYLIATDLTVAGITQDGETYPGMGWSENQVIGSKSIMVWESEDLVNWSEQRMCEVAVETAGCTWAPEAYWDDETGQYVVFWASKVSDDDNAKQRVYYATTRDFYTFSPAQVWIEENGSVIDTTVIKAGDYYYRYTKNEDGDTNEHGTPSKRIYCERSQSLTSLDWELVSKNSLDVGGGQIEGGCIFKINTDDVENAKKIAALKDYTLEGDEVYCLIADATGKTIFPGLSSDITTGSFHVLGTEANASVGGTPLYTMPEPAASHGTIMPITSEEYDNLMKAYDQEYVDAIDELTDKAVTLGDLSSVTEDLTLPAETVDGKAITWTSSDSAVITSDGKVTRPEIGAADATAELTASFTVGGTSGVREQAVEKTFTVTVKAKEAVKPPVDNNPSGGNSPSGNTPTDNQQQTPSAYKVQFADTGDTAVEAQTVTGGTAVAQPADPVRKNYTFTGWYLNGAKYDFNTPVNSDLTLTAGWKKVSVGKAKLSKVSNKKKKTCEVKVKKVSGANGYQYMIATDKKFKKGVKKSDTSKTTATFKKLKKGKTYYVRVRAYKYDSAKNKVYGSYSGAKKIKIKK